MVFCVVGGLSLCGLGFVVVSLGATLGDGTGGSAASGLIHFPIAFSTMQKPEFGPLELGPVLSLELPR